MAKDDQRYDGAVRLAVEADAAPVLASLGLPVRGPAALLRTEFPSPSRVIRGDAVVGVGDELVHLEYERRPGPGMARRMLEYRSQIVNRHPDKRLWQYVLVLGDGLVDSCDDNVTGFTLGLRTVYLREQDPARFLVHPASAPLAVLCAGDEVVRQRSLTAALKLILTHGGDDAQSLLWSAVRLAAIRLDANTINQAWKESGMVIEVDYDEDDVAFLEQLIPGQDLLRKGVRRGRAEGEAAVLAALLRTRFGDHPRIAAVAEHLATWPEPEAAVRAVMNAAGLDDLPSTGGAVTGGPDVPDQRQP